MSTFEFSRQFDNLLLKKCIFYLKFFDCHSGSYDVASCSLNVAVPGEVEKCDFGGRHGIALELYPSILGA